MKKSILWLIMIAVFITATPSFALFGIGKKKKATTELLSILVSSKTPANLVKVQELLEMGADPNATHGQLTFLSLAIEMNHDDLIVDALIAAGADANASSKKRNNYSPLGSAISSERIQVVRLLLERGADPNMPVCGSPREGYYYYPYYTPLFFAVAAGNTEIARLLLQYGAVPVPDDFIKLVKSADAEAIETLLKAGIDPNYDGNTYESNLLMAAAVTENVEIIKLLLSAGADPDITDVHGTSLLHVALKENPHAARYLRLGGAQPMVHGPSVYELWIKPFLDDYLYITLVALALLIYLTVCGFGYASMYLCLISLVLSPLSLLAIVFGHIAQVRGRKNDEKPSVAPLCLGYLILVAWVALPTLLSWKTGLSMDGIRFPHFTMLQSILPVDFAAIIFVTYLWMIILTYIYVILYIKLPDCSYTDEDSLKSSHTVWVTKSGYVGNINNTEAISVIIAIITAAVAVAVSGMLLPRVQVGFLPLGPFTLSFQVIHGLIGICIGMKAGKPIGCLLFLLMTTYWIVAGLTGNV